MQFPAILGWRPGGLSLENFEISRPENAISCDLRMEVRGFIPRKFWNFKTWKCNFLQSKDGDLEVGGLSLENFEISRPENAISCNLGIDFFSAYVQQERPFVDFFSAWKPEICQNQGNSRSFFQNQGNSRKIFKFKEIWGNPSDSRSSGQPGCVLDTLCLFFQSKVSSSNDTS